MNPMTLRLTDFTRSNALVIRSSARKLALDVTDRPLGDEELVLDMSNAAAISPSFFDEFLKTLHSEWDAMRSGGAVVRFASMSFKPSPAMNAVARTYGLIIAVEDDCNWKIALPPRS